MRYKRDSRSTFHHLSILLSHFDKYFYHCDNFYIHFDNYLCHKLNIALTTILVNTKYKILLKYLFGMTFCYKKVGKHLCLFINTTASRPITSLSLILFLLSGHSIIYFHRSIQAVHAPASFSFPYLRKGCSP